MRRPVGIALLAAAFAGAFALAGALRGAHLGDPAPAATVPGKTVLEQVRNVLAERYYRHVPARTLRRPTIAGILQSLGDPHTTYLSPSALRLLRQHTSATYTGIGLGVVESDLGLLVTAAPPGPARAAGIRRGDVIVRIDGAPTAGVPVHAAVARIVGRRGTTVRLRVLRKGSALEFTVVRQRIERKTLGATTVRHAGRRIAVLRLAGFPERSARNVRRAVRRLAAAGAAGFVLDLRSNPGGLLEEAVGVSSAFLPAGVVVTLRSVHEKPHVRRVSGHVVDEDRPLVVLVDRASASAAEVTAAALRDNGRAVLVGDRTFGKALVQSVQTLRGGAALRFTTARYLTPRGSDISHAGLRPDVRAVDDPATARDEALVAALDALARL